MAIVAAVRGAATVALRGANVTLRGTAMQTKPNRDKVTSFRSCSLLSLPSPLSSSRVARARQSRPPASLAQKNAIVSSSSLYSIHSLHPQPHQRHIHSQTDMGKQQKNDGNGITTLDDIPSLEECYEEYPKPNKADHNECAPNSLWSKRISMWKGDITKLQIDAVVNAANESLLGGGGIDGAIHRAAGRELLVECRTLRGCPTGEAKSTKAYRLPSKRIIHTVGPIGENPLKLRSCYNSVLEIVKDEKLKSVAFCCISTGIYGYDNRNAAKVALETVRDWMDSHPNEAREIERVVFCVFLDKDVQIYETLLPRFFPKDEGQSKPSDAEQETSPA